MHNDLPLLLAIAGMGFLSLNEKIILRKKLDNIADLAVLSIEEISELICRHVRSGSWNGALVERRAAQTETLLRSFDIGCVLYAERAYPVLLREIFDPPFMLFYRGNLSAAEKPCVSVVGTRNPSKEGMDAASVFAKEAARGGATLVSGLARGIDACAHRGAVAANGASVGVLPCGADTVYPAANRRLAAAMIETGGCLLSEYAPGVPPDKFRFPHRNRIIAALSPVTLVVEAPPKSGAWITAEFALEHGRDVYVHRAAFGEEARLRSRIKTAELAALKKTPDCASAERFLRDGAPIVGSYAEYLSYRSAAPGAAYCRSDAQLCFENEKR
ncbi:DNA-processing protein DprA [Treponema brennaborense]|uniref:DNA protecting protein DprA n=1 Tax=Treponema brennaborense (strain DSM 12168 / CIP 105900 / DD5/3) TaxID=906968 RepID=F4LJJ7_TREBD|nr:DNA-processing protein DprA [Treponema brennaborense]AEE16392.1 DNA protecting protein DprA [Treponema brennaborense DSM 12168]